MTGLTLCLCCLHNFCIDHGNSAETSLHKDNVYGGCKGMVPMETCNNDTEELLPQQLLDEGEHHNNASPSMRCAERLVASTQRLPRNILFDIVTGKSLRQPTPKNW